MTEIWNGIIFAGAVIGALVTIAGAVLYIHHFIVKPLKGFRSETEKLNKKIATLNKQIETITNEHEKQMRDVLQYLGNDKNKLEELQNDTRMGHDILFRILNSMIDGNGKEKLKACRQRLIDHHFELEDNYEKK